MNQQIMLPAREIILFASVVAVLFSVLFGVLGYWFRKKLAEGKVQSAEAMSARILQDAQVQVESKKREAMLEAKDRMYKAKSEFEEDIKQQKIELQGVDRKIKQREESVDRKAELIEKRERETVQRERDLHNQERTLKEKRDQADVLLKEQQLRLESVAGLTAEAAKKMLIASLEEQVKYDAAVMAKHIEDEMKEQADDKAKRILTVAISRCAMDHSVESTVSVFHLPNEELKGRIIGREGRNIRALENATGVDIVVDETPEAILISGFDGVRREIARMSLERLIADGRIHPARVEETVEKVKLEMEKILKDAGERAMIDAGVVGVHPEILKVLGRLKYRTSYSQNVLGHSVEVARLCGIMASELGLNAAMAKRAGLLHDVGKAIDHDVEGGHPQIGADLAKKYNEPQPVIEAIRDHHGDDTQRALEAILVQAADSISGGRPGARGDNKENYVKRIKALEDAALSFQGVTKCYALQAGRELRVMVEHGQLDDVRASQLCRDIAKKIETEMAYPGQIKVMVIRESRFTEYAK